MQLTNVFFREALLSAAASGALNSAQDKVNNNSQTSIVQPPKHLNNNLANNNPGKGQINKPQPQKVSNGVQRKPSTSSIPEKKRETIWDFFEQGNKKGTCRYVFNVWILYLSVRFPRTCGYVVSCKNNKGGLTRHLSLVHQREYKMYTAKMEHNWTNGMLEKNLNMRVPANL